MAAPQPRSSTFLEAALAYAAEGFSVFPLAPGSKIPLKGSQGFKDATTANEQIRAWWAEEPHANIGSTGHPVIDEDTKHGGNADLLELPPTLTARTPSGGRHFHFTAPAGVYVPSNHPGDYNGKLGRGIDMQAESAYVVLPPSVLSKSPRHTAGRYTWINPGQTVADLPEWIVERLMHQEERHVPPGAGMNGHTPRGDGADYWLNWALARSGLGVSDRTGFLLAQQLLVNQIPDPEGVLMFYAQRATLDPSDPFDERDVARWLKSAQRSGLVQRGEPARSAVVIDAAPRFAHKAHEATDAGSGQERQTTPPPSDSTPRYTFTDNGNAYRLVDHHGTNLRYCHLWAQWLRWDGTRWRLDENRQVMRLAKETVRAMYTEAAGIEDDKERKALIDHARRSESEKSLRAMVSLAQPELPIMPAELDANPWLLNVKNGTLDLRTGALGPHRREDFVTKRVPIAYDPQAECPQWLSFLNRVMKGNTALIMFLQRAIGYSLTGDTSEQVLFLLHGKGQNGKSVLLTIVEALAAEYGMQTPTSTLMVKQSEAIPNDIARLKGARFVKAVETEEGRRLAESLVKQMTGGDMMVGRFMRAEFFEFRPTFKLWLAANHKPVIRGTDDGIWRRIRLVPFAVQIPEGEQDKHIADRLRAELPGILSWAVRGCLDWKQDGLTLPDDLKAAIAGYRAEMDALADFLADCCEEHQNGRIKLADLFKSYQVWCEQSSEREMTKRQFSARIRERGFTQERGTGNALMVVGLGFPATLPNPPHQGSSSYRSDRSDRESPIVSREREYGDLTGVSGNDSNLDNSADSTAVTPCTHPQHYQCGDESRCTVCDAPLIAGMAG